MTITEKVKRITEEMHLEFMVIMMMILMEIIKMVKLISPLIYFFHKKSLYLIPCSENEKDYVLLTSGAGTHWSRCECVRPAGEEFEKILHRGPDSLSILHIRASTLIRVFRRRNMSSMAAGSDGCLSSSG